jgi:hypothetical protein
MLFFQFTSSMHTHTCVLTASNLRNTPPPHPPKQNSANAQFVEPLSKTTFLPPGKTIPKLRLFSQEAYALHISVSCIY